MLPRTRRLVDAEGFRRTVRQGRRSASRHLVVHLLVEEEGPAGVSVGFVVSKAVGPAVVRNRVKRRLRHQAREQLSSLERLPGSAVLVVRALPAAATATSAELAGDLARCLDRVVEGTRS
ncbi:ribonuclease P protein component [Nocardioides sp.]|uniref:ribonuclease P protein component n=1 Tax=Nocardioides sp. TaxID=35761 RepID=UPI0039E300C6